MLSRDQYQESQLYKSWC